MSAGLFATAPRIRVDHDTVLAMRARGLGVQTISNITGSSMEDVHRVIADAASKEARVGKVIDGLRDTDPSDHRVTWTRADVARLIQLYFVEDRSATETASIMDRSVNSIIGKATRLGLLKGKPGRKAA